VLPGIGIGHTIGWPNCFIVRIDIDLCPALMIETWDGAGIGVGIVETYTSHN
jgi:hypothetical protein